MDKESLGTTVFVYEDEMSEWKIVNFRFDNVCAIRSCGIVAKLSNDEDARRHVKAAAMSKALAYAAKTAFAPVDSTPAT